jgi:CS domain
MSNDSYCFVRIPAYPSAPVEEITADKSGGLTKDSLVAYAKRYFGGGFCNIVAVTVPTAANQHLACSMYTQMDGNESSSRENSRASALIVACGGSTTVVLGDAFCGRVHDDEEADIWERQDFTIADADPSAEWCRQARESGRGPSSSSLQNLLQTQMGAGVGKAPPAIISDPSSHPSSAHAYGMNGGAAVQESWGGCWTQTDDEVEVRLSLGPDVTAKQCQVVLGRSKLKISIAGKVQCEGTLFDPIDVDESTYTIHTEKGSLSQQQQSHQQQVVVEEQQQRELCVHLAKAHGRVTWPVLMKNP